MAGKPTQEDVHFLGNLHDFHPARLLMRQTYYSTKGRQSHEPRNHHPHQARGEAREIFGCAFYRGSRAKAQKWCFLWRTTLCPLACAHQKGLSCSLVILERRRWLERLREVQFIFIVLKNFDVARMLLNMLQCEQAWNSHLNENDNHLPNLHDSGFQLISLGAVWRSLCCREQSNRMFQI